MKTPIHRYGMTAVILFVMTVFTLQTGCAGKPFGRPPGERVASCEGKVRLTSGRTNKFRLDVFRQDDDEFKIYLTMSGRGVYYRPVTDMSYEDGVFRVETDNPGRVYEGKIAGDSMKISGQWNGISGMLNIDFDN